VTIASAVARLRALAAHFPEEERPRIAPPASDDAVEQFARGAHAPVPAELREFFAITAEIVAMDVHTGYRIGGPETLARSLTRGDHYPNAIDLSPAGGPTIPCAGDGGGNGYDLAVHDGAVWFWNHETGAAHRIATSFAAFLERVADDWEHAAAYDYKWRYLPRV
jgi:cell wall assembly regulator SMI1